MDNNYSKLEIAVKIFMCLNFFSSPINAIVNLFYR